MDDEDRKKVPKRHEIWIDIGASSKADALARVAIGDTATYDCGFELLHGSVGVARAFDDKVGAYIIGERRWIPRRMAVLHPPTQQTFSETGHWNSTCLVCHTTHGKPQFDTPFGSQPLETQKIDTTAAEFGIACEACHGPSEEHVRANSNPLRRYQLHFAKGPDATSVQPARLDPKRASQVCGQCHGVWEFYDEKGERQANSQGLPFRPGQELSETRFVAQPARNADSPTMQALLQDDSRFIRDAFWSDGTVRVSGREYNGLIESPCYRNATHADRTLTCFSCHTLHKTDEDARTAEQWRVGQVSTAAVSNEACLKCHEPLRATVTAHTHHKADSPGSSCFNCHMPYTSYGLLKTIRSHTIGSPTVKESVETGRPNACNLCHLDRTLDWTGKVLAQWYKTPEVPLGEDEQQVAGSLLWLLKGDAGQRAIIAQAMAWPPGAPSRREAFSRAARPGPLAPPRAASPEPTANVSKKIRLTSMPRPDATTGSSTAARNRLPNRVRVSTHCNTTVSAAHTAMMNRR